MKNIVRVILHTTEGDVVTAFRAECKKAIEDTIAEYLRDGKNFTIQQGN